MARSRVFRPRRNPFGRGARGAVWLLVVAALLWLLRPYLEPLVGQGEAPEFVPHGHQQVTVARVVDGDTLALSDNSRVRLIGVDTPETVKPNHPVEPFGLEAGAFTREFVGRGEVVLEFDATKQDKYGRLLGYVWVGEKMLNEELLRAGLARAETGYSFSLARKQRFLAAEDEAKAARRGIWSTGS